MLFLKIFFKKLLECGLVAPQPSEVLKFWNDIKRCQLLKCHYIKRDIKGPEFFLSQQLRNRICFVDKAIDFSASLAGST